MAHKKQKSIALEEQNLSFKEKQTLYKLLRFYPSKMSVDVIIIEDNIKQGVQNFPFAHLPKELKKLIKPN